jgi:hypothetical protein
LQGDGVLKTSISYRCMKVRDGVDYYHLASAVDDRAIKTLQERDFFQRYTERTKFVAGGEVEVLPLEVVAETDRTTVTELPTGASTQIISPPETRPSSAGRPQA